MQIIENISSIREIISTLKSEGKSIGFVPTMGALHKGHISLLKRAREENDTVVCSIFVNPTQFNNPNDLRNYPRTFEEDCLMLENEGCDLVFFPSEKEMYPVKDTRIYDLGMLDKTMEGLHRPGHFNGVAMIVKKLFEIIQPHNAYFGEKDYQQLLIISHITKFYNLGVNIIPCHTLREPDGLAMSSRNRLLSHSERAIAHVIYDLLNGAKEKAGKLSVMQVKEWVENQLNKHPEFKKEYIEIADIVMLQPVTDWNNKNIRIFAAIYLGKVRLIDNIKIF
jgi:pantoate--beta-alanine ligase